MRAYRFVKTLALIASCVQAAALTAHAQGTAAKTCWREPDPFPSHQAFLLNDPRSGLMLYVESDGRHMAAITRAGRIVWQRNLFDDPNRDRFAFVPPPHIAGEPPDSSAQWLQQAKSDFDHLYIDRIAVVSDCEIHRIDHEYRTQRFGGHYIRAGSGTKIYYLLDAKTGDFMVEGVN